MEEEEAAVKSSWTMRSLCCCSSAQQHDAAAVGDSIKKVSEQQFCEHFSYSALLQHKELIIAEELCFSLRYPALLGLV